METAAPPLVTSDSDLYNTTDELKTNASNPSNNNTDDYEHLITGDIVYISIISCLEIPIICLAIYAVYSLNKSKQAAPIFVINLLISDLIMIVSMILLTIPFRSIYFFSSVGILWTTITGVYFMTCIAVERYVLIAHPIWHRSHRSVTFFVCTSLTGWVGSLIIFLTLFIDLVLIHFMSLIAYSVVIVCFVASCRSLSRSISLTPLQKQLVLGPLFFVVINYTFLILPVNILCIMNIKFEISLHKLDGFTSKLFLLNPLVDCLLYVFMRSDAENIFRTRHCCSRLKRVRTETVQTASTEVQLDHV